MNQFEIEGNTDAQLSDTIKRTESITFKEEQNSSKESDELPTADYFEGIMCILACSFKVLYIILYCVLRFAVDSYLGLFISTCILVSIDFWVTKNLTGRKLVGLKWWSRINEQGEEQWIFESRNGQRKIHSVNASFFWMPQILAIVFWVVMLLINLIKFSFFHLSLVLFCVLLCLINFGCYFKCHGEHQKKAKELTNKIGIKSEKMF